MITLDMITLDMITLNMITLEWLKIHQAKRADEQAVENLKPLNEWFEKNKADRAKVMLSNQILLVEKEIEKVRKKLGTETDTYFKSLFNEKLNLLEKDLKRKNGNFIKKFNLSIDTYLKRL
jgi:hypothetical protein